MVNLPLRLPINVCLSDVKEVGCNVYGEHGLFIDLIDGKAGVLSLIGGGGCKDRIESDRSRLVVVTKGSGQEKLFIVRMPKQTEANYVLEAVSQRLKARAPCTQAIISGYMA